MIGYSVLAGLCTSETELEDEMEDASPHARMKAEADYSHPLERWNLLHMRPICDKFDAAKRDLYSLHIN